ncbi:DUF6214 family protein [Streptomyces sp. NPDC046870]|uniref:DUF6214 family protein n=1 Tax=Streptomyces sp. NPDC046870 TaxID=3155135 RepID=UPI003456B8BF
MRTAPAWHRGGPGGRGRWGDPGACPCVRVWSRRYVAWVPEASFLDLHDRQAEDGAVSVWPAWQVREHDGVTSWFQVRLAFSDGARVDALAVLSAGRVSIEDVQAEPALSLADLAALAGWIEGPLFAACGVEAGAGRASGPEPEARAALGVLADAGTACAGDAHDVLAPGVRVDEGVACGVYADDALAAGVGAGTGAACGVLAEADVACEGEAGSGAAGGVGAGGAGDDVDPDAGGPSAGALRPAAGPPVAGRARPPWPRGTEGRRLVAREYRAAQDAGADPVLAVMNATGRGRRRALRLIAQARDAGLLAPRHARR